MRAMMARVRIFSNLVKENTRSFGFFRARTFFGAHDISSFSRKLSMKKEMCTILNRKPKLKLAKFDERCLKNDVIAEQSKFVVYLTN